MVRLGMMARGRPIRLHLPQSLSLPTIGAAQHFDTSGCVDLNAPPSAVFDDARRFRNRPVEVAELAPPLRRIADGAMVLGIISPNSVWKTFVEA